jgi:ribosomal protein L24E
MSKTERLAAAILADRDRPASQHNVVPCFVCGHTFVYRARRGDLNGRFCSMRCQDWYDAGNEPIGEEIVYRWRDGQPMKKSANGFHINCAHCRKEFESLGMRCCSTDCERAYVERKSNLAVMAEAGIEPSARRHCEVCLAVIPKWRNGRRVSRSVRFCSEKCRKRALRAAA